MASHPLALARRRDGISIAVRAARWRPDDPQWAPRQEAQLARSNPSFVRGIAGNAQSLISVASQNLGEPGPEVAAGLRAGGAAG